MPGTRQGAARVAPCVGSVRRHLSGPRRTWLIILHGNAGDRYDRLTWFHMLKESLGCGVVCFDYRGYGGSSGAPSQRGLYLDGEAVATWAREGGVIPRGDRVVLYGESIGSSVATWMATKRRFDGLVLQAPFTSIADAGQILYPFLPVKVRGRRFHWLSVPPLPLRAPQYGCSL